MKSTTKRKSSPASGNVHVVSKKQQLGAAPVFVSENSVRQYTPPPRRIGYARVSTSDQTTALQIDALREAGCDVIYEDAGISGTLKSRPGLDAALADCKPGDCLVVWKLDRLGRSLRNLIEISEDLQQREINFISITDAVDTNTPAGRMIYAIFSAVAEFERATIRERVNAGIKAKKLRGERTGRKPALSYAQIREAQEMVALGKTATHIAKVFKVARSTVYLTLAKQTS